MRRLFNFVGAFGIAGDALQSTGTFDGEKLPGLLEVALDTELMGRYPKTDYPDCRFDLSLSMFCFPSGLFIRTEPKHPSVHFITLTNEDGSQSYAVCYSHDTQLDQSRLRTARLKIAAQLMSIPDSKPDDLPQILYTEQCFVVVSYFPYFNLFANILANYLKVHLENNVYFDSALVESFEIYLENLTLDHHPGSILRVPCCEDTESICAELALPSPDQLPVSDIDWRPLFQYLDPADIVLLFNALLLEKRVLLVSSSLYRVTCCAEAVKALLFPLIWPYVYVSVLPASMAEFIESPLPFIMGMPASVYQQCEMPEGSDLLIVELDHSSTRLTLPIVPFPQRVAMRLLQSILKYGNLYFYYRPNQTQGVQELWLAYYQRCTMNVKQTLRNHRSSSGINHDNALKRAFSRKKDVIGLDHPAAKVKASASSAILTLKTLDILYSSSESEEEDQSLAQPDQVMSPGFQNIMTRLMIQPSLERGVSGTAACNHTASVVEDTLEEAEADIGGYELSAISEELQEEHLTTASVLYRSLNSKRRTTLSRTRSQSEPTAPASLIFCGESQDAPALDIYALRKRFLAVIVSLLKEYRRFIVDPDSVPQSNSSKDIFDADSFLALAKEDISSFLDLFLKTQVFSYFLQSRMLSTQQELDLFEKLLDEKHRRKVLRLRLISNKNFSGPLLVRSGNALRYRKVVAQLHGHLSSTPGLLIFSSPSSSSASASSSSEDAKAKNIIQCRLPLGSTRISVPTKKELRDPTAFKFQLSFDDVTWNCCCSDSTDRRKWIEHIKCVVNRGKEDNLTRYHPDMEVYQRILLDLQSRDQMVLSEHNRMKQQYTPAAVSEKVMPSPAFHSGTRLTQVRDSRIVM